MNRLASLLAATLLLAACDLTMPWTSSSTPGGGGGGGTPSVTADATSVAFTRFPGGAPGGAKAVRAQFSGTMAAVGYYFTNGGRGPAWLAVDMSPLGGGAWTLSFSVATPPAAVGSSSDALVLVALDAADQIVAQATPIQLSLDVLALPTFTPASLPLTGWFEHGQPLPAQATLAAPAGAVVGAPQVDVGWCSANVSLGVVTVVGTAAATAVPAGTYSGTVTLPVTVDLDTRPVTLPISAAVGPAMQLPSSLTFTVGAATSAGDLATTATITALVPGGLSFTAASDAPWLSVGPGGLASPSAALPVSVLPGALAALGNGPHTGTITITPAAPGLSPGTIPVTLTLGLPQVVAVAPVAFSDTTATDYVVVRGSGFASPGVAFTVGGAAAASAAIVNDTTANVVPGARAAGDHAVASANALGIARPSGTLHVVDPPPYAATSVTHALGDVERVFASARHRSVFGVRCWFCGFESGVSSSLLRFAFDEGTGAWTSTSVAYTSLWDAALAPDESTLAVLTTGALLLVDPVTLTTTRTIPLPFSPNGSTYQLAFTSDGLVMVQTLSKAWSLGTGAWVDLPFLDLDTGLAGSADGGWVFWGLATNAGNVAYRLYDAAAGTRTFSSTFQHFSRGKLSRHGERGLVNTYVLGHDLALRGTLQTISSHTSDLTPDGRWACGHDGSTAAARCFDLDTASPYTARAPITLPAAPTPFTRAAVDPRGNFLFLLGETRFTVVDLR